MVRIAGLVAPRGARRSILGLGGLYLLLAGVQTVVELVRGAQPLDVVSALVLVGLPGTLILLGGLRLDGADVAPEVYPRVLAWSLAGIAALALVVVLRVVSPGATIDHPLQSASYATAIGAVAGLAIGIHEGKAISRARLAERRSAELEDAKAELEAKVQRLRELNDRLERFAFAASHDLREPARMVTTYLQLLEDRCGEDLDDEAQEYVGYAVRGSDRMRNMVRSLTEYARVTRHSQPPKPTDANAIVDAVLDELRSRIEESDAEISVDELPTVLVDGDQLAVVFRKLLGNAIAYSGDRRPCISIRAEPEDDAWRFTVEDEGIGIDPAYHEKVFEAFERLHADTETDDPGAGGIGLALCRRIVERHGGGIWVDAEAGRGSRFHFTIPRRPADADEAAG